MFVAEDDDSFPLREPRFDELDAVSNGADVAWIGVEHVLRPMLGLFAIVTEGSEELELYRPLAWNYEVALPAASRILPWDALS